MALPVPPNTTINIYRNGHSPPAAPDVANVSCYLTADFVMRMETGEGMATTDRYTHVALVDWSVDVRDGFNDWNSPIGPDQVCLPSQPGQLTGTLFVVRFVERRNRGTSSDYKKVYLDRGLPTWPTNSL